MTCAHCNQPKRIKARGLCDRCYLRLRLDGRLHEYERMSFPHDELMEEWTLLRLEGHTRSEAADRLGITKSALEKAIARERDAA